MINIVSEDLTEHCVPRCPLYLNCGYAISETLHFSWSSSPISHKLVAHPMAGGSHGLETAYKWIKSAFSSVLSFSLDPQSNIFTVYHPAVLETLPRSSSRLASDPNRSNLTTN